MDYNKIGELVKIERKKRNLTQLEFIKLADISERTLRHIETGEKVNLDTIKKVLNIIHHDIVIVKVDTQEVIEF